MLEEAKVATKTETEDGVLVERPDYWVLRVDLSQMNEVELQRLKSALNSNLEVLGMARHTRASLKKIGERYNAKTKGLEHGYVNVTGGTKASNELAGARAYLERKGLGEFLNVVPGPLFRSTHGNLISHMPLAVDSSYTHVTGALKRAYDISLTYAERDPDLDLEGRSAPKWGHHTFRRTADKWAQAARAITKATPEMIDELFGWKQAERAKVQQLAYAGPRKRAERAKVTMMT